ncbi:MAG: hypothetical protein M3132_00855 [Actinomycetia bacterium]|nr:hypothetical protein [Actinomycetes bacterium]
MIPDVADAHPRRTALTRTDVSPVLADSAATGYPPTHRYVRQFWIAVLGPGAVADLLRLTAAAHSGRSLKEPIYLESLLRIGLVVWHDGSITVADKVPPVPEYLVQRFPPALRRAHARAVPGAA